MVSISDLEPLLERSGLSYYLPSLTFGYISYLNGSRGEYFILMLIAALIATFMYVEEEILESIKADLQGEGHNEVKDEFLENKKQVRDNYAHATPWLYFETIILGLWILSLGLAVVVVLMYIDWGRDFWLTALGFLNVMYFFGWIVDQILRRKYRKHYYNKYIED